MQMMARLFGLGMLAVSLGFACGCGSKPEGEAKPDTKTPEPQPEPKKDPPTDPTPKKDPSPPSAPLATWEMNPDLHKLPAAPAAGKLGSKDFKLAEARVKGTVLTLAMPEEGKAERAFVLSFDLPKGQVIENRKLVVRPEQETEPGFPVITTKTPGDMPAVLNLVNGYSLTLELGARSNGKIPGKIYLCMPGEGKTFVAGEFTAEWERLDTDPPGPQQAPYVQGNLVVTGMPKPVVKVGYLGQPGKMAFVYDSQELDLDGAPAGLFTRSGEFGARATTILTGAEAGDPARYEHVKLPPGRYLMYATVRKATPAGAKDAPPNELWASGNWLTVGEKAEITLNVTVDTTAVGTVEAKAPAGMGKVMVMLAPAEQPGTTIDDGLFQGAALSMGMAAEATDGKAAFARILPGKYEVRAYEQPKADDPPRLIGEPQMIEVTAGKAASVDLTAKK